MADFKTHLQFGSFIGFLFAIFSYFWGWVNNFSTAIILFFATTLASFLPDIDSNNSLPVKIISLLYAYLSTALVLFYLYDNGIRSLFFMALVGVLIFVAVILILPYLLKHYTTHRGIFHSIPAALIAFFIALIISSTTRLSVLERFAMALAVFWGYMSHLVLDELYSIDLFSKKISKRDRKIIRIKKSYGTALDFGFNSNEKYPAYIAYAILVFLIIVSFPYLREIFRALK